MAAKTRAKEMRTVSESTRLPSAPATEGLLIELPLCKSKMFLFQAATSAIAPPQADTVSPKSPSTDGPREPHVYADGTGHEA